MLKGNRKEKGAGYAVMILVMAAVCVMLVFSIISVGSDSKVRGRENLKNAVRRAAVACYATEGVYPDSIEYLEDHYGLQVDRDTYTVHYTIFARNIMPVIKVTIKDNA